MDWTTAADAKGQSSRTPTSDAPLTPEDSAAAVAAIVDVLVDAGVLPQRPRALLDGPKGRGARLGRIQTHTQVVCDRDYAAYVIRSEELAYLANAILAGCSIQERPLTAQEASDAAVAVCNLGLENWPPHWSALPEDFLIAHDLVSVFQVGWRRSD